MALYVMPVTSVKALVGQLVHFTADGIPYQGLLTAFDEAADVVTLLITTPNGQQYSTQFARTDMVGLGPGLIQQGGGGQGGGGGTWPGQPGQWPGSPGQWPGQPGQWPGLPGQWPGSSGQWPGQWQGGGIFGIPLGRAYATVNGYIVIAPERRW